MEIWKDIEEFKDSYQVSNLGRVRSKERHIYTRTYPSQIMSTYIGNNDSVQDIHSVHMCYVQLSLLGISATVFQGNALENKNQKGISQNLIFRTPRKMGWLI